MSAERTTTDTSPDVRLDVRIDDGVIDLGAATARTLGIPDDLLKENFVEPEARDE